MPGRDAAPTADAPAPGAGDAAVYLFALIDGATALSAAATADGPLPVPIVHRAGAIAAIVSWVPLADYCGPAAARHLGEVAWIAPRAVQHAAILRQAMQWSAVFPVPFGTLYASLARLSAFMLTHQDTLVRFFATVAGKAEWELTASADLGRPDILERIARAARPDWAALPPGTRYLLLCRDRSQLIAAGWQRASDLVGGLAERFRPPAAVKRRIPRRRGGDAGDATPIARFALLVPEGAAARIDERMQSLRAEAAEFGISLSRSGPWPPFSFRPNLPDLRRRTDPPVPP